MIECDTIVVDKVLIYMVRRLGPRTEHLGTPECAEAKGEQLMDREKLCAR